jgi:hypothetical protein
MLAGFVGTRMMSLAGMKRGLDDAGAQGLRGAGIKQNEQQGSLKF